MISERLRKFMADAQARDAADIHIVAGAPVLYRVGKDLVPASKGSLTPEVSEELCMSLLSEAQQAHFRQAHDIDVMLSTEEGRFRVNISYNDGCVGAVMRTLPETLRGLDSLSMPPIIETIANLTKGLVLITGSTSQGKTTTMTAIIDRINHIRRRHIITIEDPIEAIHKNDMSVIRQREVGRDTESFFTGLRAALRQDPDVIAIGELRDYDSIRVALTAAETGVLVMATMHVLSIDKLLERVLSYAPPEEEGHLRNMLADTLQAVIHQELLPTVAGGKRVASEVLIASEAGRNLIRRHGAYMLRNLITTGGRRGMQTMAQSVLAMLDEGVITREVAEAVLYNYAD